MLVAILALRGAAAILVLTTLVGGVPRVAQVALAATLGLWSALLVVPADAALALPLGVAVIAAARELVIGASLGIVAAVPLLAAVAAGRLVDLAGRASRGPYTALFGVLAAAVFVGIDGHVAVIAAIVESHRAAPALGAVQPSVLAAFAGLVPIAVRLAIPWLVTAAVVEIAAGAGARVAGRAGAHAPLGAAVPAALAMMTATLVGTLAVALAHVFRS